MSIHSKLVDLLNSGQMTKCICWTVNTAPYEFNYYAGYVDDTKRWYITGPSNYYQVPREGITSDELLEILTDDSVKHVYSAARFITMRN